MAEPQGDLTGRTPEFRQKIISQINEVLSTSKNPVTNKSAGEFEEQLYRTTQTKEDYLLMVARFVCRIRGINTSPQLPAGTLTMLLNQAGTEDPAIALRTVVNYIMQTGPHGGGVGPGLGGQMLGGPGRPGFPPTGYTGGVMGNPRRTGVMQGGGQMRGVGGDMFMMQGGGGGGMRGGMVVPPNISLTGPNQMIAGGSMVQPMQQYGMNRPQQGLNQPQQPVHFNVMNTMTAQPPQLLSAAGSNLSAGTGMLMSAGTPAGSNMVPSPASILPSHSPGPGAQQLVAQSPASMRGGIGGALSPGSSVGGVGSVGIASTPGNPSSIGVVGSSVRTGTNEEQEYLDKWKQLQVYIDPLKRMISKIDKDEERKSELVKMKNLLDILSDCNKRLPMETLIKCEHVLEKQLGLQLKPSSNSAAAAGGSTGPPSVPPGGAGVTGISGGSSLGVFQQLFDTIAANISNPMFNHTMQRTFGPAYRAMHGPSMWLDSPPAKRQCVGEDLDEGGEEGEGYEIPDWVQGEIAKLPNKYKVNLDPLHHPGSKIILLTCKIEDRALPFMPEMIITLPENYPAVNPTIKCIPTTYNCNAYLERVKQIIEEEVENLTPLYSLTALLNLWDACARKAYLEFDAMP